MNISICCYSIVLAQFKPTQIIDVTSNAIVTKTIETATAPMTVAAATVAISATTGGLTKSDTLESIDADRVSDASKASAGAENGQTTTTTSSNGKQSSAVELEEANEIEAEFVNRLQTELLGRDRDRYAYNIY